MHYFYLLLFSIITQLNAIYLFFIHIFESIFHYLITERCDGRTDGRTEKHGSFYKIDN